MADIKISELPVATTISDADVLVINQGTTTKQIARSLVRNAGTVTSVAGGTGLTGGTITGAGTLAVSYGSTAGTAAQGNDSRLSDSRAPSGAAGGDLGGTYPNPTLNTVAVNKGGTGQTSYTDGQLLIGNSTGNTLAKATLTGGTNVTITNGPGTITIAASSGSATPTDVQTFTSSGTWTKPAGAVAVDVVIISGGGGGAGGRKGGATSVAPGGGGGAGGSYSMRSFAAAVLGASEPVAVGAGGTGGAAQTNVNANGFLGSPGGNSSFGTWAAVTEGLGAQTVTPGAAVPGSAASARAMFLGGSGGTGSFGAAPGTNGINSTAGSAGGGGGGGLILAPTTAIAGGAGGVALASFITGGQATAGTAGGGNGGAGSAATANTAIPGSGGAGGGSSITAANGGNGGAGGLYGGGGGGGGAGLDGVNNSGAGGNGAPGIVIVTTYF